MRAFLISLLVALVIGCSGSSTSPKVDRLEIRKSGWTALDITVNSQGQGRFSKGNYSPPDQTGTFQISPEQFASLVKRLDRYQRAAVPFNDETLRQVIEAGCPEGVPFVTDAGAIWVHWIGPSTNKHFLFDLGCDRERKSARNKDIIAIVRSLPIPAGW